MGMLKVAVVVMGVMIVAGVATLGYLIVSRAYVAPPAMAELLLDEPEGTRILAATPQGDRVALTMQGGGADRVLVVDLKTGKIVGRVSLRR